MKDKPLNARNPRSGLSEHTADLGLWVEADTLEELFSSAACALAELMVKGPRDGEIQWLPLDIDGADWSELLVALLNEVVFQADGQGLITTALKVRELGRDRLIARLGVIPLNENHRWAEPVKAVTYHQAVVEQQGNRWRGEVLMDV